ncbi:MAG: type II toxin-antitoxin system VapB family antitoxin [Caulobacter sp.]|nr:type II toxin-antitoxin system VapB family antitoxin [Caulobacter sp.]
MTSLARHGIVHSTMTRSASIQIRKLEVVKSIRELAQLRGTGLTEAVGAAVREALDRERALQRHASLAAPTV